MPLAKLSDLTGAYTYSFSGADSRPYVYFEGAEDLIRPLSSVHTISVSVYEAKGQARALGYRGIKGLARGVRTIAGSMIFTVIEDNPLRPLLDMLYEYSQKQSIRWEGWSVDRHQVGVGTALDGMDFNHRIGTLIPAFNMVMMYISEGSVYAQELDNPGIAEVSIEGAAYLLKDIEFVSEGIVTSVNDIVSEVTLSFIARDFKPITAQSLTSHQRFNPMTDAERLDAELRRKLFDERAAQRTREAQAAWQVAEIDSGFED